MMISKNYLKLDIYLILFSFVSVSVMYVGVVLSQLFFAQHKHKHKPHLRVSCICLSPTIPFSVKLTCSLLFYQNCSHYSLQSRFQKGFIFCFYYILGLLICFIWSTFPFLPFLISGFCWILCFNRYWVIKFWFLGFIWELIIWVSVFCGG